MTDTEDAGYVIVSTDLSSCLIQEYSDVASFSSFLEANEDEAALTGSLVSTLSCGFNRNFVIWLD